MFTEHADVGAELSVRRPKSNPLAPVSREGEVELRPVQEYVCRLEKVVVSS
jgi:hypothetical protein